MTRGAPKRPSITLTTAAEAAIAEGILRQVLLVIVLGEIELGRIDDLGGDGAVALLLQLGLVHRLRSLGLLLLGRERIDAGAILGGDIVALTHALCRVVALPESLEQRVVRDLLRVID